MIQLFIPHANNAATMYKELVHPKVIPDVLCLHSMTLITRIEIVGAYSTSGREEKCVQLSGGKP